MNYELTKTIDDLGRINLPSEIRKPLNWGVGDEINLCRQGDTIILSLSKKREEPECSVCGKQNQIVRINGQSYCNVCVGNAPGADDSLI